MSAEGKVAEQLSERETREVVLAKLTTLYSRRVVALYALLVPSGLVWVLYAAYMVYTKNTHTNPMYLTASLVFTVLNIFLFLLIAAYQNNYRIRLQKMIRTMPDTQRKQLLPGPGTGFQRIVKFIPGVFRGRFPHDTVTIPVQEQVELVARNLDWYLAEPRRLLRFPWVSWLYLILVLCMFLVYQVLVSEPGGMVQTTAIAFFCFLLFASVQESFIRTIGNRQEAIRIEVYREFILDWFKRHPLDDEG